MVTINLRTHYPHYKEDIFIEITDEMHEAMLVSVRQENAYNRRKYRYKAQYSLDCHDGIEHEVLHRVPSPEEVLMQQVILNQLYEAINALSETQARRIYKRYILQLKGVEVAREENVTESSIRHSIVGGLANLKKYYAKHKFER